MSQPQPGPLARDLARRVLQQEARGRRGPVVLAEAGERACAQLRQELTASLGRLGVDALFARALQRAQAEAPALERLSLAKESERCLDGLREFAAGRDHAEVTVELTTLLAHLLHLLITFLGEDLGLRLARQAWPVLAADSADREEARRTR